MAYSCPRQHKLAVEPRPDSRFRLAPATRLDLLSTNHLDADPFLGLRGRCLHGFISTASVDQHQTGTVQPRLDSVKFRPILSASIHVIYGPPLTKWALAS